MQPVNLFAKIGGGELNATIGVEHNAVRDSAEAHGVAKGVDSEETVDFAAYPASDNLTGKQV